MEEPGIKDVQKLKAKKWHDYEIKILLESWKRNYEIKRQSSDKRHNIFYETIRKDLQKECFERSKYEIKAKTRCLMNSYRQAKKRGRKNGCIGNFLFFADMMDIEKLELKGEEIIEEENGSGVIENNLPNEKCVSSASQSCFVDNYSEEKEPDEDVTKGNNELPATKEDILVSFHKAFQKTHRQLKKNDATLLELFKEQNQIFKTQAQLMKKLMNKNLSNN